MAIYIYVQLKNPIVMKRKRVHNLFKFFYVAPIKKISYFLSIKCFSVILLLRDVLFSYYSNGFPNITTIKNGDGKPQNVEYQIKYSHFSYTFM